MEIKNNFELRGYQKNILETCKNKNTLVVIPTGLGKTKIGIALAVDRLNKIPNSKILVCSPTKPLSAQICNEFRKEVSLNKELINLLTGAIAPEKRKEIFENSKIITATPQTIWSDLKNNRISLRNISMLCIDEAHRSRMRFANTIVAKNYIENAENPRILALTASPGGTKAKINEICENLFIESVEIRTNDDEDIKQHIQKKEIEYIKVDLTEEIKKIRDSINIEYKHKVKDLEKFNINTSSGKITKKLLLYYQNRFRKNLSKSNPAGYYALSLIAQVLKIGFLIELIETQTTNSAIEYFEKLKIEETKAAKFIVNNKNISDSMIKLKGLEHPKLKELKQIVIEELKNNPESKIIIFANYRNTVDELVNYLKDVAKPVKLVGQKDGVTQKQQIQTIKEFTAGKYNCLIGTSITEEGLDIIGSTTAVFYDAVPSEIRSIQRRGRVARLIPGKIIHLIAKGTKDEASLWSSYRKEKTMQNILKNMQQKQLI